MQIKWHRIGAVLAGMALLLTAGCTDYKRVTVNPIKPMSIDGMDAIITDKSFTGLVAVFGTWCRPCREELPDLGEMYDRRKPDSPALIAVSVDDGNEKKVQFLVDDLKLMFPVYHVGTDMLKRHRIYGIPTLLVVKSGDIIDKLTGQLKPTTLALKWNQLKKEMPRKPTQKN